MRFPLIQRRNISRVPSIASAGDSQRAAASVYSDIADVTGQIRRSVDAKRAQDAQEEAAQDFAEATNDREGLVPVNLPSRERKFLWFRYQDEADEAYNQVAKKLRIDRALEDYEQKSSELEMDEEIGMDAGAVDKALKAFGSEYLSNMPREERELVEMAFNDRRTETVQSIALARQEADRKEAADTSIRRITSNKQRLSNILEREGLDAMESPEVQRLIGEVEGNVSQLVNDPWFEYSDGWGEDQNAELADLITAAGISGEAQIVAEAAYLDGGAEAANEAISTLSDLYGEDLPFAVLDKATARADAWVASQERERIAAEREAEKATREAQTAAYNAALRDNVDGNLSAEEAREMFVNDQITDGQYTSLYQSIRAREARKAKEAEDDEALRLGTLLDPTDVTTQKAVDRLYRESLEGQGDQADPVQTLFSVVSQYGVVPETAADFIRAGAMNGDPDQRQAAYTMLAQIDDMRPAAAAAEFKGNLLKDARYFEDQAIAVGPLAALEAMNGIQERRRDPILNDRFDEGLKLAQDRIDQATLRNTLDKNSGTFFSDPDYSIDPVTTARMVSIMQEAYADSFADYSDPKFAMKHARKVAREAFGVSRASGSARMMSHPPENYYSVPNSSNDWMNAQLLDDVATIVEDVSEFDQFDIVSDLTTASEATTTGRPSYAIIARRNDGALEALPGRWQPDPTEPLSSLRADLEAQREEFDIEGLAARRVAQEERMFRSNVSPRGGLVQLQFQRERSSRTQEVDERTAP